MDDGYASRLSTDRHPKRLTPTIAVLVIVATTNAIDPTGFDPYLIDPSLVG